MKKNKILSILLALLISISVFSGLLGCNWTGKESFTVTFVGGEGAVLVSGKAVQKVTDASQIQPPVFERPGYAFDSWSLVLGDISEDTTVEAIWYRGYKVELNNRYYDVVRNNREITIGYSSLRGNIIKIPYDTRLGAVGTLYPEPNIGDGDYLFLRWEIVINGKSFPLTEETVFNDELFVGFGMAPNEAINNTLTYKVNPILEYDGHYAPLN